MNFLSSHHLHITPLSPVHIGCNETYEPTNYVIHDDTLYEFNADNAITALPSVAQEQLLKIVSGKPNEEMLKQVQAFFHQHREALVAQAEHCFPVGDGVAKLYAKRIGKAAQYESRGRQVLNKLEIERSSYNPMDRKPLFPGSSIKGAIRTALLDQVNDGEPLSQEIRGKKPFQQNQALQESLFEGKFATDPMRLVSVGDARWANAEAIPGNEIRFAVNRPRKPREGQRLQQSMTEEKGPYPILECVSSLQPRCLTTSINLHNPQQLADRHADKLPQKALQWSIKDIAKACNRFYQKLLKQEIEAMRKMGYLDTDWITVMNSLLSPELLQKLAKQEAFLLRLGRHSGAEALTLEGVRSIKIMGGKNGKDRWEDKPQTWWLAAGDTDSKSSMTPFGWVLVEIDADLSQPLPAQAEMERFNTHRHQWYADQQQRQMALKEKLTLQQQQEKQRLEAEAAAREKREEQERQQAEKAAAEAAKREAELARMNPLEREIAEYPSVLEATKTLETGHWQDGELQQAAQFLKARMQREGVWKESTASKKPDKDKDFQRTQTVMKFL